MRILAVTSLYPNPYQPHRAPFNRQQFRAIAREHEMCVIAPVAWTSEWQARRRCESSLLDDHRARLCDGMIVHHPRYIFPPKLLRGLHGRCMMESIRNCFRDAVAAFSPDIVLGCWAYPDGWAAAQLARKSNLPMAIKVHGSDLLMIGGNRAKQRRITEAFAAAGATIAVSRHLADRAIQMGAAPERVHVVHNGIDSTVFSPQSRQEARRRLKLACADPLILFIGNLVPVKGIDVLLDALRLLLNGGQPFECKIIGDGPLRNTFQHRIDELGLGSRAALIGSRPQEELPLWYQASNLVVLPSRSEGIPNVLLEAGACGVPFVASNVGGIPEIAPAAALVPPGDSRALAQRIAAFLDPSPPTRNVAVFRTHSWTDSARAMVAILREVVTAAKEKSKLAG